MSKAAKTKEYAVHYLYKDMKVEPAEIAKELGMKLVDVNKVLGIENEEPKTQTKKSTKTHELMIRNTNNKGINNVSIMTPAAAAASEEAQKKAMDKRSKKTNSAIFRPNDK